MRWRTRCARPRSGSAATRSRSTWSTPRSWPSRCGEPWAERHWPTDSIRLQIASHILEALVPDPVVVEELTKTYHGSVLDNEFSGLANLRLHARLWRVPDPDARIASLLDAVGLTERASDSVRTYSGGMRRRLEIARALMARPSVLFLDEPTLGLDPIVRQELWQTIGALRERERVTVLLSTHYLEEAESVCGRVGIVDRGEIIAHDAPATLVDAVGRQMLDLTVDGDPTGALAALAELGPSVGQTLRVGPTVSV